MILGATICELAMATMMTVAGPTAMECVSVEDRDAMGMEHAAGWYNGDTDTAYVVGDLSFEYTKEVLWHELAHAWDLRKGTALNGFPSFFSETRTGFTVEEFARLQTLYLGQWPEGETYPDVVPTSAEWSAMEVAGWLMRIETERYTDAPRSTP